MKFNNVFFKAICFLSLILALSTSSCLADNISASYRNLTEKLFVINNGYSITEKNIVFVMELIKTREEIEFDSVLAYLSSGKLNRTFKSEILAKERKISATISDAKEASSGSIIFAKPDKNESYSDNNVVLYLKNHDCFYLYFSFDEIDEVFEVAQEKMEDDLETISCLHPYFDSDILDALRKELDRLNIKLKHAELSEKEVEKLRILTSAGILENKLRNIGVKFKTAEPLLKSGLWGRAYSPKLTLAFQDKTILEQIRSSSETKVVKSFNYLMGKKVIKLD